MPQSPSKSSADLDTSSINTIRTLSMDAVQKANSGHPGTPMALAPVAFPSVAEPPALRSGRAAVAEPRPLRAVGRACVDAAVFDAAPDRRESRRSRRQADRHARPCRWTTSSISASWTARRRATRIPHDHGRRNHHRSARARAWQQRRHGDGRALVRVAFQQAGCEAFRLSRVRAVRRRRHDGRHLARSRVAWPVT